MRAFYKVFSILLASALLASCGGSHGAGPLPSTGGAPGSPNASIPASMPQSLARVVDQAAHGIIPSGPKASLKLAPLTSKGKIPELPKVMRPLSGTTGAASGSASAVEGTVNLGAQVTLGPVAPVGGATGCNTGDQTASVANVTLPPTVTAGAAQSFFTNVDESNLTGAAARSNVANVNLLGGLITATGVQAVSESVGDFRGFFESIDYDSFGNHSSFVGLAVLGVPIISPAPNTVINLPTIGSVTLDEQVRNTTSTSTLLTVTMIHVRVTVAGNPLGLPVGADIAIARATSAYGPSQGGAVTYFAGGIGPEALVFLNGQLASQVGPFMSAAAPCTGGSGGSTLATATLPNILSAGVATGVGATAFQAGVAYDVGIITLANANVLSNLLTLTSLKGTAFVGSNGVLFGSTELIGATLNGSPLPVNPAPNTVIGVPGVATVTLNEQTSFTSPAVTGMFVVPVDIQLLAPIGSLGTGSRILLGEAVAQVNSF